MLCLGIFPFGKPLDLQFLDHSCWEYCHFKTRLNLLKSGDTLQEIFEEAGFPEGVFLHFEISHSEVEEMIANPIIKGVSLTGSEVGRKITKQQAKI